MSAACAAKAADVVADWLSVAAVQESVTVHQLLTHAAAGNASLLSALGGCQQQCLKIERAQELDDSTHVLSRGQTHARTTDLDAQVV
jgi:hypothetical protein